MTPCLVRRVALACLALAVCLPAATHDPWLKITSANFELYTTANERTGRDLIRHFEQVRSFFLQAFGSRLPASRPARIIAFRNEKEYRPYRPNEFATAFFQPGAYHDLIVISSASSERYPVAVHEYTHLMIRQSGMELPPWLNEGLAELYSSLDPVGDRVLVGQLIPERLLVLRREPWIPLAALLAADHSSPYYNEKSHAGMFYAESWALVHMLNLDPIYRPQLKFLVAALKENDPPAAFAKAYGKPVEEVEAALHAYFTAPTVHAQLFDVQLPKTIDAPVIQAAAFLPARLALAELLANRRGAGEQARAAYDRLANDYPDRWEVEEGQARFAWQRRDLEGAAQHFGRAVELGCKNLKSLLLYARVLGYNEHPKEEADALRKAVALFPDSVEANLELGAALVRTGDYGPAAATLLAVRKPGTAEEAYRLYYNLAYAQYRLGDAVHARQNIVKARTYTKIPAAIADIDRLRDTLDAPTSVEGVLENMECGALARLHLRTEGVVKVFVMPDPTRMVTRNAHGEPVELRCGPQNPPHALRIEYQATSPIPGVAGLVRSLEFQ